MPPKPARGRKSGHKGQARTFTSEDEIRRQAREVEEEKRRDEEKGSDDEGSGRRVQIDENSRIQRFVQESSESSSEDEPLIEVHNPNRVTQKMKKISDLTLEETNRSVPGNRKEREAAEAAKRAAAYQKKHAAGETEEAQRDLARLELVRKQRAEAAAKREAEKKAKEEAALAAKAANPAVKAQQPKDNAKSGAKSKK